MGQELIAQADEGQPDAQVRVGLAYAQGKGLPKDPVRAVDYLQRAASQRFPAGVYHYAIQLAKGEGCNADVPRALDLLEGVAGAGLVCALELLGTLYYDGQLVPVDLPRAAELFLRAGELGSISALHRYAQMNYQGTGIPVNLSRALAYYRRAHVKGYGPSSCDYAKMVMEGSGRSADVDSGVQILRQAAETGYNRAQFNLASLFLNGKTVPANLPEARRLFEMAAKSGYPKAMVVWALCLRRGIGAGVPVPTEAVAEAKRICERVVAMAPGEVEVGDLVRARTSLGAICLEEKDYDAAYTHFELAANMEIWPAAIRYAEMTCNSKLPRGFRRDPRKAKGYIQMFLAEESLPPDAMKDLPKARDLLTRLDRG
jgi:TPR repeat protein